MMPADGGDHGVRVGDQAYVLGATLVSKVGDVVVVVEGSNVSHVTDNAKLKAIALPFSLSSSGSGRRFRFTY